MSKLINYGKLGVITLALGLLATSCKKDKEPFPKQPSSGGTTQDYKYDTPILPVLADADGMLIAAEVHNYHTSTISPFEATFQYGLAAFTNTTGNFTILTNGGSVTIDTSSLTQSATTGLYQSNPTTYSLNFALNPSAWNVSGNGSVPAMTYTVAAGQPAYSYFPDTYTAVSNYWKDTWVPTCPRVLHKDTIQVFKPTTVTPPQPNHTDSVRWQTQTVAYNDSLGKYNTYKADSIKFNADSLWNLSSFDSVAVSGYVTNADSVIVTWHDENGYKFTRSAAASAPYIYFKPNDFANKCNNYSIDANFKMEINLVKYNSATFGGKKYYYLRMTSYIKYWRSK